MTVNKYNIYLYRFKWQFVFGGIMNWNNNSLSFPIAVLLQKQNNPYAVLNANRCEKLAGDLILRMKMQGKSARKQYYRQAGRFL